LAEYPFVQLARRFLDISSIDPEDDPKSNMLLRMRDERAGKSWDDLLAHDAAIILGSAGSGKTTEVLAQAKQLRSNGIFAFVLRLEALCRQPVVQSFSPKDQDARLSFENWQKSGGKAIAFLDALDEARLPDAKNTTVLADALSQLSTDVGRVGQSLSIVLTARASEWRGSSDLNLVKDALKGMRPQRSGPSKDRLSTNVYRLDKLDSGEIDALAQSRGVNADQFVLSINNARAANLATQPLDVHFLLDVWLEEVSASRTPELAFSSRRHIFEKITSSRLRTGTDEERRSNLDPIQARRACEKLAAAVVISGIRDLTVELVGLNTLSALNILATDSERWTEVDVRQLLSSSIFHPSVGGRIRFSHRELEDFLAAGYFDQHLKKNAGSPEVIAPLLAVGFGPDIIPQSTEKVFGWLSAINPTGRRLVTLLRPALLIEAGDPTSLSSDEKMDALRAQVDLYVDRGYRGEWFHHNDMREFAAPDMAPTVRELLVSSTSPEAREFLIEVARFGQMKDVAPILGTIATDPEETLRVRAEACFALTELDDQQYGKNVLLGALSATPPELENIQAAPAWNEFQIAALTYAYPSDATLLDAISLIASLRREARNHSSMSSHHLQQFVAKLDHEQRASWLQILLIFATGNRNPQQYQMPIVVPRYNFFSTAICHLTLELLNANKEEEHEKDVLNALEYLFQLDEEPGIARQRTPFKELAETLLPKTALKERLIDRRIELIDTGQQESRIAFNAIHPLSIGRQNTTVPIFAAQDVKTFCDRMKDCSSPRDVQLAYECARDISFMLSDNKEGEKARLLISKAARRYGSKEIRSAYGLFAPTRTFIERFRHDYKYRVWNKFRKALSRFRGQVQVVKNAILFFRKQIRIRNGTADRLLVWAVRRSPNAPGDKTLETIAENYGRTIAEWFASGFRHYWKRNSIEYSQRSTFGATVGLVGLALQSPDEISRCTPDQVSLAFRYAFCDLNGFPVWLHALATENVDSFRHVAQSIVCEDLASDDDTSGSSDGLRNIAYSSAHIRDLVAQSILFELEKDVHPRFADLESALNIVSRSPVNDAENLSIFLLAGFQSSFIAFEFNRAWIWLDCLFLVNAPAAWEALVGTLGGNWTNASSSLFFCFLARDTRSFSRAEDLPQERNNLMESPSVLANLVRAAYVIFPPNNDPFHEDVYSPGAADRASDRRRYYLNELVRIGSQEALDALDELIDDSLLVNHRDSFFYHRDLLVRNSSRRPEYTVDDTIAFLNTVSKPPSTVDEFRRLVERHLEALLKQLHLADDDESFVFRSGRAMEADLRNWLSGRLRDVGDDHYTVIREQEVAIENRPDLRVHARKKELGQISIEIKLADEEHWSGDLLVEKVDTQLAQQYIHEDGSHTGFYVLANAAKPKKREVDKKTKRVVRRAFRKRVSGKFVDFDGLIAAVEEKAALVNAGLEGDKVVKVISINLSEK
jgi:hypothetical protein